MTVHQKYLIASLALGLSLFAVGFSACVVASVEAEDGDSEHLSQASPPKTQRQVDTPDIGSAHVKGAQLRDIAYKLEDLDVQAYGVPLAGLIKTLQQEKESTIYIKLGPKKRVRLSTIKDQYNTALRNLESSKESLELLSSQKAEVERRVNLLKSDLEETHGPDRDPIFSSISAVYAEFGASNGKAYHQANARNQKMAKQQITALEKELSSLRRQIDDVEPLAYVSHQEVLSHIKNKPSDTLRITSSEEERLIQKALAEYFPE